MPLPSNTFLQTTLLKMLGSLGYLSYPCLAWSDEVPDAADLFRRATAVTQWVDDSEILRIEANVRFLRSPEGIAARMVRLARENGDKFDPEQPDYARQLRSETKGNLLLASDRNRILSEYDLNDLIYERAVWSDGRGYRKISSPGGNLNPIELSSQPSLAISHHYFSWLPWSQTGFHPSPWKRLWQDDKEMRDYDEQNYGNQAQWTCWGRVVFNGSRCWLVHRGVVGNWARYYLECDSGRFLGLRDGSWGIEYRKATAPLIVRELKARGVPDVEDSTAEVQLKKVSAEMRQEIFQAIRKEGDDAYFERLPHMDWIFEVKLMDYREVAPGKLFPMRQKWSYQIQDGDKLIIDESREVEVTRFTVGENLDAKECSWSIPDGTLVYDTTHDVPIRYRQDSQRTAAELEALLAQAREERDRREKRQPR